MGLEKAAFFFSPELNHLTVKNCISIRQAQGTYRKSSIYTLGRVYIIKKFSSHMAVLLWQTIMHDIQVSVEHYITNCSLLAFLEKCEDLCSFGNSVYLCINVATVANV
jgi:hypothetical protein